MSIIMNFENKLEFCYDLVNNLENKSGFIYNSIFIFGG